MCERLGGEQERELKLAEKAGGRGGGLQAHVMCD